MKDNIKVSIIIPVYNSEKYIEKCIESAINQTLDNIEIIIINDGSKDSSEKIINKYLNKSNIKLISKENEGCGIARNIGIQNSKGEYIFFLDSDDYIEKDALRKMYEIAIKENVSIVKGSIISIYGFIKGKNILYSNKNNEIIDFRKDKDLLIRESNIVCNKLIKKDLLKNITFSNNLKWEDLAIITPLLIKAKKMYLMKDFTYYYRLTINNTTISDYFKPNKKFLDIFETIKHLYKNLDYINYDKSYDNILKQISILHSTYRIENIYFWKIKKNIKNKLLGIFSSLINIEYSNYYKDIIFIKNINGNIFYKASNKRALKLSKEYANTDKEKLVVEFINLIER